MKSMNANPEITEMEGLVLSLICRDGALTAYEIKENFRASPSRYWSGSAGAIYPLVKRLEQRRILTSKDISETKRPRRVFSLTPLGSDLMMQWLSDVDRALDPGYDPLRSRLMFISILPTRDRDKFLSAVNDRIEATEAPSGSTSQVQKLHDLWVTARAQWLRAFTSFIQNRK